MHAAGILIPALEDPAPTLLRWMAGLDPEPRLRLERVLDAAPAVCHLDLHAKNLIDDGARLWLIDWVDGGVATVGFEAAVGAAYWAGDAGWGAARAFLEAREAACGVTVATEVVCAAAHLLLARAETFGSARVAGLRAALDSEAPLS